jgi:hypothetical protein
MASPFSKGGIYPATDEREQKAISDGWQADVVLAGAWEACFRYTASDSIGVRMATITFDTHEFVKKLRAAGFTEQQAEALTETVRAAQGVDLAHLATRTDLLEVENRLIKWGVAIALGQAALIATLVKLL